MSFLPSNTQPAGNRRAVTGFACPPRRNRRPRRESERFRLRNRKRLPGRRGGLRVSVFRGRANTRFAPTGSYSDVDRARAYGCWRIRGSPLRTRAMLLGVNLVFTLAFFAEGTRGRRQASPLRGGGPVSRPHALSRLFIGRRRFDDHEKACVAKCPGVSGLLCAAGLRKKGAGARRRCDLFAPADGGQAVDKLGSRQGTFLPPKTAAILTLVPSIC